MRFRDLFHTAQLMKLATLGAGEPHQVESPTNPLLTLVDTGALVEAVRAAQARTGRTQLRGGHAIPFFPDGSRYIYIYIYNIYIYIYS